MAIFNKNVQSGKNEEDNKRYKGSKKNGGDDKKGIDAANKLAIQGIHTLSGDNVHQIANGIISEGALGALLNSHINEGIGNLSACNDSLENQNINFWANQNHNEFNRADTGTQHRHRTTGQNSVLSNQVNLTKHIMSLDEVEISDQNGKDGWKNPKSPTTIQKMKQNNQSR